MWPFASKGVRERLDDLEATTNKLKSDFKRVEGEWEATYQKLHAVRVSLNAKLKKAEAAEDAPETTTVADRVDHTEPDAVLLRRAFGRR